MTGLGPASPLPCPKGWWSPCCQPFIPRKLPSVPPSLLPGQASPWPSSTGPELVSAMARSGKGSVLHHQHLEAQSEVGGFGQSVSGLLVWERKMDLRLFSS